MMPYIDVLVSGTHPTPEVWSVESDTDYGLSLCDGCHRICFLGAQVKLYNRQT